MTPLGARLAGSGSTVVMSRCALILAVVDGITPRLVHALSVSTDRERNSLRDKAG